MNEELLDPELKRLQEQYARDKEETAIQDTPTPTTPVTPEPDPIPAADAQIAANQQLLDKFKPNDVSMSSYLSDTNNLLGLSEQEKKDLPRNLAEGIAAVPIGQLDFGGDLIKGISGKLGLSTEKLDDVWDEKTKFKNPAIQSIREMSSVVLPTVGAVASGNIQVAATRLPLLWKGLASIGMTAAIDATMISISDEGEKDTAMTALANTFPGVFGTDGIIPIHEKFITLSGDSAAVRKEKNRYESVALSIAADILGYTLSLGKPIMKWFKPNDSTAAAYKASQQAVNADNATMIRMQKIEESLATGALTTAEKKALIKEQERLAKELVTTGQSSQTDNGLESYIKRQTDTRDAQTTASAVEKLQSGKTGFDPDIYSEVSSDASKARQSFEPGSVANNMGQTTGIKKGDIAGDPSPMFTESMLRKGLASGGSTRNSVMGVAKHTEMMGDWDAIIDGFKYTKKDMDDAAWEIYQSIMRADSKESLKKLFISDKDFTKIIEGVTRNRQLAGMSQTVEVEMRGMAFALRDLTDRYLGRSVTTTSARAMDTLGREVSTIAEAGRAFKETADPDRINELILDKMQFLFEEYGINKYVSGWQLQNKNFWNNFLRRQNPQEIATATAEEFQQALNKEHAKAMEFRKTLETVAKDEPLTMKALVDSYALSHGDVDTIMKLNKYVENELTWKGLIKSPDPNRVNTFTKSLWAVRYNNILSGPAALAALVGNTGSLILKPINSFLGAGIESITKGSIEPLKKAVYYHAAVRETNRRALTDAFQTLKMVNNDPKAMMGRIREDFVLKEDKTWEIFESLVPHWEATNNRGMLIQYQIAKNAHEMSKMSALRYGMTGMSGVDSYTNTALATHISRLRAWDDVFTKHGKVTPELLRIAEKKHYATMFDKNGLIKDSAVKSAAGEIALNLDDGIATYMNKATTAVPLLKGALMFPRTGMNSVKMASSYTPLMAIPGLNKYSAVLHAGNSIDKKIAALAQHGIDYHTTPNADAIFQNLKNEYTGRLAFSGLLAATGFGYAMDGNIRGNGPASASERRRMRSLGWRPKEIKILGKWISFKGIPGVEPVLTLLGDMAYYHNDLGEAPLANFQDKLSWSLSATFLNETPMQGIETLISLFNQDEAALKRFAANEVLSYVPQIGALTVVANAIDSAQKDIHNDMFDYIKNRLPLAKSTLPNQIDIWTGEPLNNIDNPLLSALQAGSPVKVHDAGEDWRQKMLESGWDGISMLRKDSTGKFEYSNTQREAINKILGTYKLFEGVKEILNSPTYEDQVNAMRMFRRSNVTYEQIKMNEQSLPMFRELNNFVRRAIKDAELELQKTQPEIYQTIIDQRLIDNYIRSGDVKSAIGVAEQNKEDVTRLINTRK